MSHTVLGRRVSQRARQLLDAFAAPDIGDWKVAGDDGADTTSSQVRQSVIQAMGQHQCDHYTRRPGLASLCERVGQALAVDPDRGVLITGSLSEARFVAARALAPGNPVYWPRPVSIPYEAGLAFAGAEAISLNLESDLPDARGGLLILPNPDPLTRRMVDRDVLARLAKWVAQAHLTVVADEDRVPLSGHGQPFVRFATLPRMASRTVTIGGFGAPGLHAWQVSWIAGPAALVTAVRDLKQAMTICTNAPGQYAALASLGSATAAAESEGRSEQ